MYLFNKFRQLNTYQRAVLLGLPLATGLLLALLILDPGSLLLSDGFLCLITIPTFFGNIIAGSTHMGRAIDAARITLSKKTPLPPVGPRERFGSLLGVALGIAISILFILQKVTIPFTGALCGAANLVFTLRNMNVFGSLGQRVGNCADPTPRPKNEKHAMSITAILGLVVGTLLFLTATAALVSIVGVLSFFSGGAAIPAWVAAIIFVSSYTSAVASGAEYTTKAWNFMQSTPENQPFIKKRFHEYRGSAVGVSAGMIIGIAVLVGLIISQPHLFVGIVGVITAITLFTACVGTLGGLCSRCGRLIDGWIDPQPPSPKTETTQMQSPSPRSTSADLIKHFSTTSNSSLSPQPTSALRTDANVFQPMLFSDTDHDAAQVHSATDSPEHSLSHDHFKASSSPTLSC